MCVATATSSPSSSTVSEAKLAANRANAQKSTGPRTEAGKRRSALNATTHGLRSANPDPTLPGEDPRAFESFRDHLHADFSPQTALESSLVDRLASLLWRLNRIPSIEHYLAYWQRNLRKNNHDHEQSQYRKKDRDPFPEPRPQVLLADYFTAKDDKENPVCRLQRYETTLTRTLNQTLTTLRQLQKDRQTSPPQPDDEELPIEPTQTPPCTTGVPPVPTTPDHDQPQLPIEPTPQPSATDDSPVHPLPTNQTPLPNEPTQTARDADVSPAQPLTQQPIQNEPNPQPIPQSATPNPQSPPPLPQKQERPETTIPGRPNSPDECLNTSCK